MSSIPCDIVVLPNKELASRTIALSEQLQTYGTFYTLKDGEYYPHASLYMTQLKVADLDKVQAILTDIVASTPVLNLTSTRYGQKEGYIDVDYDRSDTLDRLQMDVITAINPIRDDMREKDKVRILTAIGKVRDNLEEYGYRGVGELFRPHMTLSRFADVQMSIDTNKLPAPSEFSGQFVKLGLFEMGDNGTCVRKIAECNLGKQII